MKHEGMQEERSEETSPNLSMRRRQGTPARECRHANQLHCTSAQPQAVHPCMGMHEARRALCGSMSA
jgi:hypothetical protein